MIFLLGLFLINVFAANPAPKLSISVQGHYQNTQTLVYNVNGVWSCKTEILPYFETSKMPYDEKYLKILRALTLNKKGIHECRDRVVIVDRSQKPMATFEGCREAYPFAEFLDDIDKNCGR